jgi:uncharacterized surface protein with fasciclin (FAS1) repeats
MKKAILTVIAVLAIGFLSNNLFAQAPPAAPAASAAPTGNVLATLSVNPDYNAFGIALRAANLSATLNGAGPYTILAPNNVILSSMSSGKLDSLMADPAKLAAILKGHIISGTYDKAALVKTLGSGTPTLTTLDGNKLTLSVTDKHLTFTDSQGDKAKVIAFDILGTNGVIIGIDNILTK